jgi:cysteine-rich repeat protein
MMAYYINSTTNLCQDICGDSHTPNKTGICDDGNLISGDGCSSTCTVEYGYICSVQVLGGISKCAEKVTITISYLYT